TPTIPSHSLSLPSAPHFWCWRLLIHTNTGLCMHSQFFPDFFRCCFGRCALFKITAIFRVSRCCSLPFELGMFSMLGGPRGIHNTRMRDSVTPIV
ncbi:hypothetical protein B0H12DRAFT_1136199, partial [Mycena haematopus]